MTAGPSGAGAPQSDAPPEFVAGQVVTVFRSKRRPGTDDAYGPLAEAMLEAARAQPGFVDFASFESPDGDRVSLVTFDSQDAHDAWRDDPAHRAAQARGRDELYEWYAVQVSTCRSATSWERPAD
ncbi:MAG TPA: antibiotic biosynthesis monooxygenase [Acidimicrobiales bacterium]